jgi:hypothetical protein
MAAIGRNEPCPCGSGQKYKRCCALKKDRMSFGSRLGVSLVAFMLVAGAVFMLTALNETNDGQLAPTRVWHNDHWDYPGQQH